MKKKLLALALVLALILSVGGTPALAYAFPGSSAAPRDDVRYFDMTAAEYIDRFNAKYGSMGLTLLADPSHANCWLAVNGDRTDIRIQFSDKVNGPVTTGSGLDMQEWNWLYAYITTSDYTVDVQYFASLPMLCSQLASVLGCEFTQEEFIDHCTTYGSDYPRMQYTKGGLENEIRFRDSSVGDYHQTVYSVSIQLLQDTPEAEAKESEKKEASDEKTLAAAANISSEQITVPSSPEAQTYAEAERLLAAGDIAHAAMAFGRIVGYKDAWERSSALWQEINPGKTIDTSGIHIVGVKNDGTVVATGDNTNGQCNVGDWRDIVSISAGRMHTVGLQSAGKVVAVGYNGHGECDLSDWTDIIAVAAGDQRTLGLRESGTVISAGHYGISGYADYNFSSWDNVVSIAVGNSHCVALRADGTVVATGSNDHGQCNVSSWTDVVSVAAGWNYTIGLRADGTVLATKYFEQPRYDHYWGQCEISGWTDIASIAAGNEYSVGLHSDGKLIITELLENTYYRRSDIDLGQFKVGNWTNITAIASAGSHYYGAFTVGLRADGTAIATGNSIYTPCDISSWHDLKVPTRISTFTSTPASVDPSAPDGSFNYTVLQNEPGYIYDKFDDYWTWYAAYDEAYSDADLLIGIQLEGEVGGSDLAGATLYTKIRNKENRVIDGVQSMAFLVDGVKYSFPEMPGEDGAMAGSVVLYKNGYELIKAFANAKEVSVKLKLFSGGTVLLDLDSAQFDRTLGNMCRKIIQYKVWDYYIENPGVEMLEMMFPMEITKK